MDDAVVNIGSPRLDRAVSETHSETCARKPPMEDACLTLVPHSLKFLTASVLPAVSSLPRGQKKRERERAMFATLGGSAELASKSLL